MAHGSGPRIHRRQAGGRAGRRCAGAQIPPKRAAPNHGAVGLLARGCGIVARHMPNHIRAAIACCALLPSIAAAQSAAARHDEAVSTSISYVFATDLGSGVYDLGGRTLQIYRLTYTKELREPTPEKFGARLDLPVTFGFLDFSPVDVISRGLPTRIDSFSA